MRMKHAVAQHLYYCGRHLLCIKVHKYSRLTIDGEFLGTPTPGRDHRTAARHCLERRDAQPLLVRWNHTQIERAQVLSQLGATSVRNELHPLGNSEMGQA